MIIKRYKMLMILILSILSLNNTNTSNALTLAKNHRGNGDIGNSNILRTLFIENTNKALRTPLNRFKRYSIATLTGLASFYILKQAIKYIKGNPDCIIYQRDKILYSSDDEFYYRNKMTTAFNYLMPISISTISNKLIKYNQTKKTNYIALKHLFTNWNKYKHEIDKELHNYFEHLIKLYKQNSNIIKRNSSKIVNNIKSMIE